MEAGAAVTVRGAYKRYSRHQVVLNGINMTVPKGSIYGLLGPSGCGKTTLLSCIVGKQPLDAGEIKVRVHSRHQLGYMPQEIALFPEISIRETLTYYGMLFGKSLSEISKRTDELRNLLMLPASHNKLQDLSGGQQRRVSFCVALLHNPELLILDEPTVGVDPLLSQNIWEHLLHLATKEQKTILITTHYIEETRQAHLVGLMREGILLAEESPMTLLSMHNCDNLEAAFLHLSQRQSSLQAIQEAQAVEYPVPKKKPKPPLEETTGMNLYRVLAQIIKHFYWMKGNIPIMCFLLVLPVVQCIIFNICIGQDPKGLDIAVVSDELVNGLSECYTVPHRGCHLDSHLSCRYMDKLREKYIDLVNYNTLEDGLTAVRKNDVWGLIHFSDTFSTSFMERQDEYLSRNITDETLDKAEINVWVDMSNQYIGNLLKKDMTKGYLNFIKELYGDCGWSPQSADIPINFKDPIYGTTEPKFAEYTAPAILCLFEFYLPLTFTVGAFLMEKKAGILERSLVAGAQTSEILAALLVVQLMVLGVQTFLMLTIYLFFSNPLVGSMLLVILIMMLVGVCGMIYGFLMSVLCDDDRAAAFLGIGTVFSLSMLSGLMWPIEGMHDILKSVGSVMPLTIPTEAIRGVAARGWDLSHPLVQQGFCIIIGWNIILTIFTWLVVKWRRGIGRK